MIPHRIITTWIHDKRNPYTDEHRALFARCLESWKRLMPLWEIRVITAENIFEPGYDAWAHARIEEGNFIGASHWARYAWLKDRGGVYLDMDVEAIRPFDSLIRERFIVGRQKDRFVNVAVIGAEQNHPMLDLLLTGMKRQDPNDPQFGNECGPRLMTKLLRGVPRKDVSVAIPEVFYPYHWNEPFDASCITDHTLAVHHWASVWWPPKPETTMAC